MLKSTRGSTIIAMKEYAHGLIFAKEICELSGHNCNITPIHSQEYPSKVTRPHYSVLDKTKFKETFGIPVPYWKDSLKKMY